MNSLPPDPDADIDQPSAEFAAALEAFERGSNTAPARRATADLPPGTKVRGTVVSIGDEHALVDFGGRSEGVAETRHFRADDGSLRIAPGDALDLFVVEAGDQVVLAPSIRAESHAAMRQVRQAHAAGVPVTGRVKGLNAGGLAVDLGGVRGFCPVSQIEAGYCADPSVYVGRTLEFVVTEVEEGRRSAVLSRRQLLRRADEERIRRMVASLAPGDEVEATVARLEPFGAFVDLGGVDGLVHVSEIMHGRVGHPRDVLREGEKVRVRVLRIDAGKEGRSRIALSIKAAAPDPWTGIETRFATGTRVRGVVARLAEFGAFVTVAPGIDGLVHVSEVALRPVKHVKEALSVGEEIETVVLSVDPVKRRISLSIRQAIEGSLPPTEVTVTAEAVGAPVATGAAGPARQDAAATTAPQDAAATMVPQDAPPARKPAEEPAVTTMALALRKAMEEARKKAGG